MAEEFDPAWEYWEPDPEIAEVAFGVYRLDPVDALGLEGDDYGARAFYRSGGTNFGLRFGAGDPDAVLIEPDPAPFPIRDVRRPQRVRCKRCGEPFSALTRVVCPTCCPKGGGTRATLKPRPCEGCKRPFVPLKSRFKYCSRECLYRNLASRPFAPRSVPAATGCPACGNNVAESAAGRTKEYCSERCRRVMAFRRLRARNARLKGKSK